MKISILHPSFKRPKLAKECHNLWMGNAEDKNEIEYILCLSEKDPRVAEYMEIFRETKALRIIIPENGLVKQVNHAATVSSGNLIISISDDFACPEFWDTLLLSKLGGKEDYVVKTQDGLQPYIITLPIMDRAYYNRMGHIYASEYYHMYGDEELADVGKMLNRTIVMPYYFRHNHYSTGINPKDEVNVKNDSFMLVDRETFQKRKKNNFGIILLSILIPTIESRSMMLAALWATLRSQIGNYPVEIITDDGPGSIGEKRNRLLAAAKGEYLCFIDDDDKVADHYVYSLMSALQGHPDCCSLNGIYTEDGANPTQFAHSIKYNSYFEKDGILYRPPNHLNTIKASIAKQFKFPEISFGEDTDWAMQISRSGLLKKEEFIDETLYFYRYIRNKSYAV